MSCRWNVSCRWNDMVTCVLYLYVVYSMCVSMYRLGGIFHDLLTLARTRLVFLFGPIAKSVHHTLPSHM